MAINYMKNGILEFLGLDDEDEDKQRLQQDRWKSRRHALYREDVAPVPEGDTIDSRRKGRGVPHQKQKKPVSVLTWKAVSKLVGIKKEKKRKLGLGELGRSFKPSYLDELPNRDFNTFKKELFYDEEPYKALPPQSYPESAALFGEKKMYDEPDSYPMRDLLKKPLDLKKLNTSVMENEKEKISKHRAMITSLEDRICDAINCDCKSDPAIEAHSYRPYFTYYITFAQTVILIVTMAVYGVAYLGFDEVEETDLVLKPNLAIDLVRRAEIGNIWIGPRKADLIHLGAKYSPCMRKDPNLFRVLELDLAEERRTGCCIRDDSSGCVQTVEEKCSKILSTFARRNSTNPDPKNGRSFGTVCGQDPYYCKKPASVPPYEWDKTDFTKWPICESTSKPGHNDSAISREDRHMTCELLGHPCCHGIQGECMITTREHCDFVRGYFHEEANLCAQVNCFEQICGMIPFYNSAIPDQFTRVFTTIMLHAGVLHLLVTILFQLIVMRWVEKFVGWHRMMFIYVGSGCVGSLASAVLLPYQVEVGPSGAQFGVLACMYVDIINNILILKSKVYKDESMKQLKIWLVIYSIILFLLFFLGLFPWLDNWAHLFGFLFGILISLTVMRDVENKDRGIKRIYVVIISFTLALVMFILLLIIFYVVPITEGSFLKYFNCIPFSDTICQDMGVSINRGSTYSKYT